MTQILRKKNNNMGSSSIFFLCVLSAFLLYVVTPQPLSTNSRWVVNESGQRVKLACVNWVAHLEVVVAEGLSKQPVDAISERILDMGFNCVRLTWALFLFTNDTLASITVRESFENLGLVEFIAGLQANNPSIVDLSLIDAYQWSFMMFTFDIYSKIYPCTTQLLVKIWRNRFAVKFSRNTWVGTVLMGCGRLIRSRHLIRWPSLIQ